MNKGEFIDQLAKKAKLTKKDARKALDTTLDLIISTLAKKEKISFVGFGTFEPKRRKATTKMNPRTRRPINVPAKTVPGFRPGRNFKQAVARGR